MTERAACEKEREAEREGFQFCVRSGCCQEKIRKKKKKKESETRSVQVHKKKKKRKQKKVEVKKREVGVRECGTRSDEEKKINK